MKPPKSRKAELGSNATGGEKSHTETAESAEFKMTELGPIPVDWEVKRLGDVSSLITKGTTPTSVGCDFECYGINFIKAESISDNGDFIPEKFAHIDEHTDMLLSRSKLKKGDFLFSIAGVLGRVALVTDEVLPANTNQALAVIRLGSNNIIDKRYLFFALKSEYLRSRVKEENVVAAQANLSLQDVNDFHVALPPLAEQRRIARALSDVDELISALGKLIEKKRNIKTGAMQELLTGKTRLPGFGAEFKMTELGPIPKDWEVKRLGDVAPLQRGFDLPFSHLMEGVVPVVYSNGIGAYHSKGMCKGPGLVTGRSGTIGKFFYIESGDYWPHNTTLWVTDFCGNNPLFVKYLYETLEFEDFSTGTGVPTLNRNSVHEHKVGVPPTLSEQKAIAAALSDMDAEIAALEADRAKYESIKQGMMQELLTGRTRLKGE